METALGNDGNAGRGESLCSGSQETDEFRGHGGVDSDGSPAPRYRGGAALETPRIECSFVGGQRTRLTFDDEARETMLLAQTHAPGKGGHAVAGEARKCRKDHSTWPYLDAGVRPDSAGLRIETHGLMLPALP